MSRCSRAFLKAAQTEKFREFMKQRGLEVEASSSTEFRKAIDSEYVAMGDVLKSIGMTKQ